jgi:hypothetical protein
LIFHVYAYFISLLLLLIFVDREKLHINVYGGIIAAIYMTILNLIVSKLDFWQYNNVYSYLPSGLYFLEHINIFMIGIAFNMGILFLQLMPQNIYLQLGHALVWAFFYILLKYIFVWFGLMTYIKIKPYAASHVLLFLLSLAWFKANFLNKDKPAVSRC